MSPRDREARAGIRVATEERCFSVLPPSRRCHPLRACGSSSWRHSGVVSLCPSDGFRSYLAGSQISCSFQRPRGWLLQAALSPRPHVQSTHGDVLLVKPKTPVQALLSLLAGTSKRSEPAHTKERQRAVQTDRASGPTPNIRGAFVLETFRPLDPTPHTLVTFLEVPAGTFISKECPPLRWFLAVAQRQGIFFLILSPSPVPCFFC